MDIASTMIVPTTDSIDESSRIQLANAIGETVLSPLLPRWLAPILVVDGLESVLADGQFSICSPTYPSDDAGVALELIDHYLKLASELLSGVLVSDSDVPRARAVVIWILDLGAQRRHILDNENTELIARLVEQSWLNLDLYESVSCDLGLD